MDIKLNDQFDLEFDGRNDLPTVTGRQLFEQRLRLSVVSFFQEALGNTDRNNVQELIELQAGRVVDQFDELVSVGNIQTEYDEDVPNTINIIINYDSGDSFDFAITE